MASFIEENPNIKTTMKVASRENILNELSNFELDIAITGTVPLSKELITQPFGDPIIFISHQNHL